MIVGQSRKRVMINIKSEGYFYAVLIHFIYFFQNLNLLLAFFNKFISCSFDLFIHINTRLLLEFFMSIFQKEWRI
jgi:hypothetical protein